MAGIAGGLLENIMGKLASKALSEIALQMELDGELQNLEDTVSIIKDVLEDAEARQVKEKAIRSWLLKLKDLAFEAEDVLDDFAFEAEKLKKSNKVRDFLSLPKNIVFQREIALRVKDINKRLDEIAERRSKLTLNVGIVGSDRIERSNIREETSSTIDESEFYGRDEDKKKIVEFLMNTSVGGDIGVIGIVGLGGLGKTTLAKSVYNDKSVSDKHFSKKMWVCVSEESEITRLVKLIMESATGKPFPLMNRDAMESSLKTELQGERFLLVLDDVWNVSAEKWNELRTLLKVGAEGSKVIVTTRNERIASFRGMIPPHRLSSLSVDDCSKLFESRAFVDNGAERNSNLILIGKEIVKKCGGVPLAAKALGSLLRFKNNEKDWQDIRDSELWSLPVDENNNILPSLKLSYNHLSSSPLKQCFAYCSIFPKDFNIKTKMLVQLWGAEGFLEPSAGHMHWEQIGLQYVHDLHARSLFQVSKDKRGMITRVQMHDLVHDLAQSVAGDECSNIYVDTERYPSQYSRYASVINNEEPLSAKLQLLCQAKKLRTLYLSGVEVVSEVAEESDQNVLNVILSNINLLRALHLENDSLKALPHSLEKLTHLRYLHISSTSLETFPPCISTLYNLQTLSLSNSGIKSIPDSIGNLHNLCTLNIKKCQGLKSLPCSIGQLNCLRELDCSFTKIESLPESICNLSNLHTLTLNNCLYLEELPQNLSDIKNLVKLNIEGWNSLTCMPINLRKLNQLRTLPLFIIGGKTNCTLAELGNLKLEGNLKLRNLVNVRNVEEAKDAQLNHKHNIRSLELDWELNGFFLDYSIGVEDPNVNVKIQLIENVFQSLEPSKSIEDLKIIGYIGRTFPSWMESLSNLVRLTLYYCRCEKIPTLGLLPHLQCLFLNELPLVKRLGSDFYGGANAFSSLQKLEVSYMEGLEEWCSAGGEQLLPCLHYLRLENCPKLKELPSIFSSVEILWGNVDDEPLSSFLQNGGFPNLKFVNGTLCYKKNMMPEGTD